MTIYGSDVSHYDAVDTRAMFTQGIVFQTHKAGGDANDAELAPWWNRVKSYRPGVLLGAYWVLYPGNPAGRADAFIARLDSECDGWRDGPFILQADCERWNGDQETVPSVAEVNAFCDRLVARMPKLQPIGYLPDWVYGNIAGLRYPLWSSKYVTGSGGFKALYPGDGSSRWDAYGGKEPTILQYSSSATIGGQTTCDANAYRGTLAELTEILAPGWITKEDDMAGFDTADAKTLFGYKGVNNPAQRADHDTNPLVTLSWALSDMYGMIYNLRDLLNAQAAGVAKILANVTADDAEAAQIVAAIQAAQAATVTDVVTQLTAAGRSDEDVADALRAALGDRAAAIGALLSA